MTVLFCRGRSSGVEASWALFLAKHTFPWSCVLHIKNVVAYTRWGSYYTCVWGGYCDTPFLQACTHGWPGVKLHDSSSLLIQLDGSSCAGMCEYVRLSWRSCARLAGISGWFPPAPNNRTSALARCPHRGSCGTMCPRTRVFPLAWCSRRIFTTLHACPMADKQPYLNHGMQNKVV